MRIHIYFLLFMLTFFSFAVQAQVNVTLQGQLNYSAGVNEVWGYVDGQGNEYALVGIQNGVSIVDITTDPANPTELHFVGGASSNWRDMKVWSHYAYIVNESSGGVQIVDLSSLPVSITTSSTDLGIGFTDAHNIFIDENGIGYLFGGSTGIGGAIMFDIASNPTAPTHLGTYSTAYIHDGFVRGDTMWSSEIYQGRFAAVDVSDKANPVVLATHPTPKNFTHNCWVSDDGNTIFTTDEKSGAWVAAYDVSDLGDIQETDRYRTLPGTGVIPHNTFVRGNFLITSYYTSGITIVDATHPHNLVQVGNYDTSNNSGGGFTGCWGVYPYLPSGTILASDRQQGLFVLTPTYVQACYLEGVITDSSDGMPIFDALATLDGVTDANTHLDHADFSGFYALGVPTTGTYDLIVSADGYYSDTVVVTFTTNGVLVTQNVALTPILPCDLPPNGLLTENVTYNSAVLGWNNGLGAVAYMVRYREVGTTNWTTFSTVNSSVNLSGLNPVTTYEFEVQTDCGGGLLSSFSEAVIFATLDPPCTQADLVVGDATAYSVSLSWIMAEFADTYTVRYKDTSATTWLEVVTSNTSIDLIGLGSCAIYEVQLQSHCMANTSGFSESTLFSTLGCEPPVLVEVLLEGAYVGSGMMNNSLQTNGLLPNAQPFWGSPWNYQSGEMVTTFPVNTTDWVLVEIRDAANNFVVIDRKAGLLLQDGTVVDVAGNAGLHFANLTPGIDYYIAVRHRNHLAVLSAYTFNFPSAQAYDFSSSVSQVLGVQQLRDMGDGYFAMVAGDLDGNGIISVTDFNIYTAQSASINQYLAGDLNLDLNVTVSDFNVFQPNSSWIGVEQVRY